MNERDKITTKVVIDTKTNVVKIIVGVFEDEEEMILAAQLICRQLEIDYIPDMPLYMDDEETVH
jgi:hypothetical protein|tara:strand:- start:221 stop:412 length:192 start_codon:yes stop_codon:yes gene_type:complete